LFKAFELGDGQEFRFQPGAEREARLVYFSHDVDAGQHFNLHNMPVYGPIEYKGKPIAIDIFVLELDAEDAQTNALLKTLASVGAMAYAPAAPVLGVLEKLGAALLSSGTDDTEFRYSLVLDPSGGYTGTVYGTLEAGDYVFIRQENRSAQTAWNDLYYDHNTGRLWTAAADGTMSDKPYMENTYLTVQILKNAGTESITLEQNSFGPFRDALERDTATRVKQLENALLPELNNLVRLRVHARNFNTAQKLNEGVITELGRGNKAGAMNKAFELCQIIDQARKSVDGTTGTMKDDSNLDYDQLEYLFRRLRTRAKLDKFAELETYSAKGSANFTVENCMDVATRQPS
jgi:hypothetical protein